MLSISYPNPSSNPFLDAAERFLELINDDDRDEYAVDEAMELALENAMEWMESELRDFLETVKDAVLHTECEECQGDGTVPCETCSGGDIDGPYPDGDCPDCSGDMEIECTKCEGSGLRFK